MSNSVLYDISLLAGAVELTYRLLIRFRRNFCMLIKIKIIVYHEDGMKAVLVLLYPKNDPYLLIID